MPTKHAARLVGGPFDGDTGALLLPAPDDVPDCLWAWACPHGSRCNLGGVHWYLEDPPPRAAKYAHHGDEHDRVLKAPVQVYVWDGVANPDLISGRTREPVLHG